MAWHSDRLDDMAWHSDRLDESDAPWHGTQIDLTVTNLKARYTG